MAHRGLTMLGYKVLEATTGSEGLTTVKQHAGPLDLVLCDVVMPEMGGQAFAAELLKLRPGVPVLFMSGFTDEDMVNRGLLEAGREFIQKPFNPDTLARRVREMLDRSKQA
jgi:two-component system, cell cycle sensor histidine kinase and response regulator CckA